MEKELLEELKELRDYLEIPKEDFIEIMVAAKSRQYGSKMNITDEMIYEIVKEALQSYDNRLSHDVGEVVFDEYLDKKKSAEELVKRAIKNLGY